MFLLEPIESNGAVTCYDMILEVVGTTVSLLTSIWSCKEGNKIGCKYSQN